MVLIILNIVAIVNLLFIAITLLIKKPRSNENRLLSVIIFDPIFSMIFIVLLYCKQAANYPIIFYISYLFDFLWAPLFYFFIQLLLHKEIKLGTKTLLHFSLFFAGCIFFTWFAFQPDGYKQQIFLQAQTENYPWQLYILDYLTVLQVAIYLWVCSSIIKKYNRHIKQVFSNTDNLSRWWTQKFIPLFVFFGIAVYLPLLLNTDLILPLITLPMASLIMYYYLNYKVISSPLILSKEALLIIEQTKEVTETCKGNLITSGITLELANMLEKRLIKEKLFLDPDLNIQSLAECCHTKVYILSAFINRHYNKSFYDYINYYRIEEAKMLLTAPDQQKYSIDSVTEKSGFRSRSAFYKAFRKETGHTPGEFVKDTFNQ
jgi:AraC-like DNA-binding protein